jgi:hypothetical protein
MAKGKVRDWAVWKPAPPDAISRRKSLHPYIFNDLHDSDTPSEQYNIRLPGFIEWALERSLTPFHNLRITPTHAGKRVFFSEPVHPRRELSQEERESWL